MFGLYVKSKLLLIRPANDGCGTTQGGGVGIWQGAWLVVNPGPMPPRRTIDEIKRDGHSSSLPVRRSRERQPIPHSLRTKSHLSCK
jgi:hypothetical protein